ncbi:MAG: hypothetical protein ACO3A4_10890 [Silvanigrellaceae bacterium]
MIFLVQNFAFREARAESEAVAPQAPKPQDEANDEKPKNQEADGQVTITTQNKCKITISTENINFLLLKQGSIVWVRRDNSAIPARIERASGKTIDALLKKAHCQLPLEGAEVLLKKPYDFANPSTSSTLTTGSSEETSESSKPNKKGPDIAKGPDAAIFSRNIPDDGLMFLAGATQLSSSNISIVRYQSRLTYEWFSAPSRNVRNSREGFTFGMGPVFRGFKTFGVNDKTGEFSGKTFNGELFTRLGFRYAKGILGVTLGPTFNYTFMIKSDSGSKFFPEGTTNYVGTDGQLDFSISQNLRIALVSNYTFIFTGSANVSGIKMIDFLGGLWFLF